MNTVALPLKIRANTFKADTKQGVLHLMKSGFHHRINSWVIEGTVLAKQNQSALGDTIRLYHLQKFNKKSIQTQKVATRGKNKGKNITTSTVVRRPHWVATYIDVPEVLVKSVKQNNRTFNLELGL